MRWPIGTIALLSLILSLSATRVQSAGSCACKTESCIDGHSARLCARSTCQDGAVVFVPKAARIDPEVWRAYDQAVAVCQSVGAVLPSIAQQQCVSNLFRGLHLRSPAVPREMHAWYASQRTTLPSAKLYTKLAVVCMKTPIKTCRNGRVLFVPDIQGYDIFEQRSKVSPAAARDICQRSNGIRAPSVQWAKECGVSFFAQLSLGKSPSFIEASSHFHTSNGLCNHGKIGSCRVLCLAPDYCSRPGACQPNLCAGANACHANKICTVMGSAPECQCAGGYQQVNTGGCVDIDECLNSTTCPSPFICRNTLGSFQCHCAGGYKRENASSCTDINECSDPNNCATTSICRNTPGSFQCVCKLDGRLDGMLCPSQSAIETPVCGGLFIPFAATYAEASAECRSRFSSAVAAIMNATDCRTVHGLGLLASRPGLSPLRVWQGNCQSSSDCSYLELTTGSPVRIVPVASGAERAFFFCELVNECESNITCPTPSKTKCVDTLSSFRCECLPGYTGEGPSCVDIDECVAGQSPCRESFFSSQCINTPGSYRCVPDSNRLAVILGGSSAGALVLVASVAVLRCLVRRRRRLRQAQADQPTPGEPGEEPEYYDASMISNYASGNTGPADFGMTGDLGYRDPMPSPPGKQHQLHYVVPASLTCSRSSWEDVDIEGTAEYEPSLVSQECHTGEEDYHADYYASAFQN